MSSSTKKTYQLALPPESPESPDNTNKKSTSKNDKQEKTQELKVVTNNKHMFISKKESLESLKQYQSEMKRQKLDNKNGKNIQPEQQTKTAPAGSKPKKDQPPRKTPYEILFEQNQRLAKELELTRHKLVLKETHIRKFDSENFALRELIVDRENSRDSYRTVYDQLLVEINALKNENAEIRVNMTKESQQKDLSHIEMKAGKPYSNRQSCIMSSTISGSNSTMNPNASRISFDTRMSLNGSGNQQKKRSDVVIGGPSDTPLISEELMTQAAAEAAATRQEDLMNVDSEGQDIDSHESPVVVDDEVITEEEPTPAENTEPDPKPVSLVKRISPFGIFTDSRDPEPELNKEIDKNFKDLSEFLFVESPFSDAKAVSLTKTKGNNKTNRKVNSIPTSARKKKEQTESVISSAKRAVKRKSIDKSDDSSGMEEDPEQQQNQLPPRPMAPKATPSGQRMKKNVSTENLNNNQQSDRPHIPLPPGRKEATPTGGRIKKTVSTENLNQKQQEQESVSLEPKSTPTRRMLPETAQPPPLPPKARHKKMIQGSENQQPLPPKAPCKPRAPLGAAAVNVPKPPLPVAPASKKIPTTSKPDGEYIREKILPRILKLSSSSESSRHQKHKENRPDSPIRSEGKRARKTISYKELPVGSKMRRYGDSVVIAKRAIQESL